jgi:selenocysteine lyase/cysteine desulfurase
MTHAANALGTVQPIEAVAAIVRDHGAILLVDAAQSAGVVPIDLQATPIDLLAFPGHKALFGPTGTGVLYVGPRADLRPWREGGTGGDSNYPVQPQELPYRLEGGTPNVLGIAGLQAGIAWVRERGLDALRRHEVGLLQAVVDWVGRSADGWTIAGAWDADRHVGALSLVVPDPDRADPQEIVAILDGSCGIAARGGLHCAPYAHRGVGTFPHGTVRVSPGPFTTHEDIQALLTALDEIGAACYGGRGSG